VTGSSSEDEVQASRRDHARWPGVRAAASGRLAPDDVARASSLSPSPALLAPRDDAHVSEGATPQRGDDAHSECAVGVEGRLGACVGVDVGVFGCPLLICSSLRGEDDEETSRCGFELPSLIACSADASAAGGDEGAQSRRVCEGDESALLGRRVHLMRSMSSPLRAPSASFSAVPFAATLAAAENTGAVGADTWQLLARCAASTEPPAGEGMSTRKQGAVVHHDDLAAHRDGAQAGAGAKRCRADALRSPEAQ